MTTGVARHSIARNRYLPAIAAGGGGFTFEDLIFKGLALGAPYVKLIGMARGPVAAAAITDLRYVMDVDEGRAEEILDS
jgi:hypothetical protein